LLSHAHEHDLPHADAPCLERYETEEGLGLLVGYPLIEGMEAHIHVGLNETVLHDQVERTRNEIFGITVGVALVAALIGVFLSRSIARPLERLSESLRAFGERRVERELDYRGGGREVADLTCAFNQMIAERVRAEEALRESEIKFRSLVENLPDVILVVARDGTILTINRMVTPSALPEQAIGRKVYDFVLPEHADRMKENIERVGPGPQGPESAWYDIHLVPVWDDEQVISVMQISRDVTERKQAEEALRLERDNLINILEAMEDGVYIVNQQYDIQYVNPVLEKDFGPYEGRKCYAYFHEREEVCPWCKNQDVFAGKTVRWEWYSFKNQRTYDLIDTPLKNPDGSISKLEIFRDITERKRAAEALRVSARQWQTTFDALSDSVCLIDLEGTILRCNEGTAKLLGKPLDEIIGATCWELVHGTSEPIAGCPIVRMQRSRRRETLALPVGNRWLNVTVDPLLDEEGSLIGAVHVIADITERVRAEEKIKEYSENLQRLVEERTAELREMVNLMTGREVRMAELKEVIRQLHTQLEDAGLTPVADDPLAAWMEE
jgi:PAS domain S-box-containing protein